MDAALVVQGYVNLVDCKKKKIFRKKKHHVTKEFAESTPVSYTQIVFSRS